MRSLQLSRAVSSCARCRTTTAARTPLVTPSLYPRHTAIRPIRVYSTSTSVRGAASSSDASSSSKPYTYGSTSYHRDPWSNAPPTILSKLDRRLHQLPNHPISILRQIVESHFASFTPVSPSSPIVTVEQNFDELGFAPDHPGRSLTDSYYLNKTHMLRTHTSAHEVETYRRGLDRWLLSADVYRRDEIDSSHYPVFHQMEGACTWGPDQLAAIEADNVRLAEKLSNMPLVIEDDTQISASNPYQAQHDPQLAGAITQNLKHSLNSLIFRLFGPLSTPESPLRVRWIEAFFPFTSPSYEVEVFWNGAWLELLGCGVVQQRTLDQAGQQHKAGWAFGLGLERLCMVLFQIPDIRLFWSEDKRFIDQFRDGQITSFKAYSKYPPCWRDMSFWLPPQAEDGAGAVGSQGGKGGKAWHENDYCEIVREVAGDLVETVELQDSFTHPKTHRQSKTYRLNYRSMDRNLSNEEVNDLQAEVARRVTAEMHIEMR